MNEGALDRISLEMRDNAGETLPNWGKKDDSVSFLGASFNRNIEQVYQRRRRNENLWGKI